VKCRCLITTGVLLVIVIVINIIYGRRGHNLNWEGLARNRYLSSVGHVNICSRKEIFMDNWIHSDFLLWWKISTSRAMYGIITLLFGMATDALFKNYIYIIYVIKIQCFSKSWNVFVSRNSLILWRVVFCLQ
jgi:hypothetical protein